MPQAEAQALLRDTRRLILPAGTLEFWGPHLPLGADAIVLERLADDLSARTGVARAPLLPFGARGGSRVGRAGTAALSRKALHRVMNELIAAWEEDAGVREVVVLTAHAVEAHLEALSTIRAVGTVRVVDIFGFDFRSLLDQPAASVHGGELDTSLIAFLRPDLLSDPAVLERHQASVEKGRRLYGFILDRVADFCFPEQGISPPPLL